MANSEIQFNPFDYKAITFLEWLAQVEANPLFQGKPQWLKILLAGRLDILASYIDARANNNMFHSMYTKENIHNFARILGYEFDSPQPASGTIQVTLKATTSLPVTIPLSQLVFATNENVGKEPVYYQSDNDVIFTNLVQSISVIEGRIYVDEPIVTFAGTSFEEFLISRSNIIKGNITLVINNLLWSEVNNLLDSINTDRHYRVIVRDTGTYFRGGDGVYGSLFPIGFSPRITARYGGGTRGNQLAGKVTTYIGTSQYIQSCVNSQIMSGGQGEESIDSIKTYAPLYVIAQDNAISANDFKYFSETYPGASRAYVKSNAYGPGSASVQLVPNGGGNPSTILKNGLSALLKEKSLLSNIFITVENPLYYTVDINIEAQLESGINWEDIEDYLHVGVILLISETNKEFKEIYKSEGIASLITYLNTLFGFTFDSNDPSVQWQIQKLIENVTARDWGYDVFENIFFTMADLINGIDFIDLITPSATVDIPDDYLPTLGDIILSPRNKPVRESKAILALSDSVYQSLKVDSFSQIDMLFTARCDGEVV